MKIRNLVEGYQFHYFTASLWAVFSSSSSPLPNMIFGAMKIFLKILLYRQLYLEKIMLDKEFTWKLGIITEK